MMTKYQGCLYVFRFGSRKILMLTINVGRQENSLKNPRVGESLLSLLSGNTFCRLSKLIYVHTSKNETRQIRDHTSAVSRI